MSAASALKAARTAGVSIAIDSGDLLLKARAQPAAALIDVLTRHKSGVIPLLRVGADGWSGEDWLAFFDERAGIAEFDGGLPREIAEVQAFEACVIGWLNRNPARSPPGRCLRCGGNELAHDPLLPFGTEKSGHAWLHSRCWPTWHADRKAEAIAALAKLGIMTSGPNQCLSLF
jgi:hypothetical protein